MKRALLVIFALALVGMFAAEADAAPRRGFGRGFRAGFRGRAFGVRGFRRGFGGRVGVGAAVVTNDVFLPGVALVPAVAPVVVVPAPVAVARGGFRGGRRR